MKQLKIALEKVGLRGMKQGEKRYKVFHLPSAQFISYLGYPESKNKKPPVVAIFKSKAAAGHARDFVTGWNDKYKLRCFGFIHPVPKTQLHVDLFEIMEVDEHENTQNQNF